MNKSKRKIALLAGITGLMSIGVSASLGVEIPEEKGKYLKNFSVPINEQHVNATTNKIACQANVYATNASMLYPGKTFERFNSKSIEIEQKFKKVYLINNTDDYNVNNFYQEIKQTPQGSDDRYISGQDTIFTTIDSDRNERTNVNCPNWIPTYLKNIKVDKTDNNINWGVSASDLTIGTTKIWNHGEDIDNIHTNVTYGDQTYEVIKDAPYLKYSDAITNEVDDVYSIDNIFLKNTFIMEKRSFGIDSRLDTYIYTMLPNTFIKDDAIRIDTPVSDTKALTHGRFTLDNLISIEQCSYDNKTMKIGVDHKLLSITETITNEHNYIKNLINNYTMSVGDANFQNEYKLGIQYYLNRNQIDSTNLDYVMNDCAQAVLNQNIDIKNLYIYKTLDNMLVYHPSQLQQWVKDQGLNEFDNPQLIFEDLSNQLVIEIKYATSNPFKTDVLDNKVLTTTLGELIEEDITVPLFADQINQYKFQLQSIKSKEINTYDTYIQGGSTTKVKINDANISIDENTNTYLINKPTIVDAQFKDGSDSEKKYLYPCQLDDQQVFNMFVTLIDSYKNIGNYSMLSSDQFRIDRNEFNGTIDVYLFFGDNILHHRIENFKKANVDFLNIDGSKYQYNLTPPDLDNNTIKQILIANDFDPYIANICNYEIIMNDNENGKSEVMITLVKDHEYENQLIGKKFTINKLQKYYIQQSQNIPSNLLKLKPSEIRISDFKQKFIVMSDEFFNRHNDDLQIKLTPDNRNKSLHAHISYYENDVLIELDFDYYGFDKSISRTSIILFTVAGIFGLGALIVIGYLAYKKVFKKRFNRNAK